MKNDDFKLFSFLAKSPKYPPPPPPFGKNSIFGLQQIFTGKLNQCVQKPPLGKLLELPTDQSQRNSPKMELGLVLGLVHFAIGLVDSNHHLPDGQVKFFGELK